MALSTEQQEQIDTAATGACEAAATAYGSPELGALCGPLVTALMPILSDIFGSVESALANLATGGLFGPFEACGTFSPANEVVAGVPQAGFIDTWHLALTTLGQVWTAARTHLQLPAQAYTPGLMAGEWANALAGMGRAADSLAAAWGGTLGAYTIAQQANIGSSALAPARGSQDEAFADLLYAILFNVSWGWNASRGLQANNAGNPTAYSGGGSMNIAQIPGRVEDCDNYQVAANAGRDTNLVSGGGPFAISCDGEWDSKCTCNNCVTMFDAFVAHIWSQQLSALQQAIPIAIGRIIAQAHGVDMSKVAIYNTVMNSTGIAKSIAETDTGLIGGGSGQAGPAGSTSTIVTLAAVGAVATAGYFTWPMWGPKMLRWLR